MDFIVTTDDKLVFEKSLPLDELKSLAEEIAEKLQSKKPFCLWLEGDLGAGKTTFTKELFYALGLERNIPVGSPTYTYLLEYPIDGKHFAHMDLYRFAKDIPFDEEEMLGHQSYDGFILEWPNNVGLPDSMQATHKLHISSRGSSNRTYHFYECE